jgi:outer membrane protein TolC
MVLKPFKKSKSLILMISQATCLVVLFFSFSHLRAEEPVTPAESPKTATSPDPSLEGILKSTLKQNGMIQEANQDVEIARSQIELARSALFPKANATILAAPMFEVRGDTNNSRTNTGKWGPFLQGSLQVVQPLYSFGMISNYQKAANEQVEAKTGLADAKKNDVTLMAKEFYYGYLMARELESLVEDLSSFLDDAIKTTEDKSESQKSKSKIKPHDLYQLKNALADLKQKKLYANAAKKTAEKALNWVSSSSFESFDSLNSGVESFEKKTLEQYLDLAQKNRPEFKALASGIKARNALKEAKEAQSYPVIFLGGMINKAWSPVADKQMSVFANDPFNGIQGGVGLGLRFDLEFSRHSAEVHEQEAEMMKLKATESYAAPGIELQVKKAYLELEQAVQGLEIAEDRKKMGKKWFVSNAMGFSIGITPAKDLMESLEGSGNARKNYIETVYSLNMALARLSQAVGTEVTHLKYQ